MDRLADSVTWAIVRRIGRSGPPGSSREAPLGTRSLGALKLYLQAEQYYRQGQWDSSAVAARGAVELDSTFGLALHRLGWAIAWQNYDFPAAVPYLVRAAVLDHGLGSRDSLLLALDSMAIAATGPGRVRDVVETALARYPDDPEVWFLAGEMRTHRLFYFGISPEQQIATFERSIALDSAFLPAYLHPIGLRAAIGDLAGARRLTTAARKANPTDPEARLLEVLLDPNRRNSVETERLLATLPAGALVSVQAILSIWPDTQESAVRLARALLVRSREVQRDPNGPTAAEGLAGALASRGHVREAYRTAGGESNGIFGQVAPFGGLPPDSATAGFRARVRAGKLSTAGLAWLARIRDTVTLRMAVRTADSLGWLGSPEAREDAMIATAYLALGRRDSSAALRGLGELPDSMCFCRPQAMLDRASLLAGRDPQAAYEALPYSLISGNGMTPVELVALFERARLAERLGRPKQAAQWYTYVDASWQRADPELRAYAQAARAGLERLAKSRPAP